MIQRQKKKKEETNIGVVEDAYPGITWVKKATLRYSRTHTRFGTYNWS